MIKLWPGNQSVLRCLCVHSTGKNIRLIVFVKLDPKQRRVLFTDKEITLDSRWVRGVICYSSALTRKIQSKLLGPQTQDSVRWKQSNIHPRWTWSFLECAACGVISARMLAVCPHINTQQDSRASCSVNGCNKCHGPSNGCWDIPIWTKMKEQPTDRHGHSYSHDRLHPSYFLLMHILYVTSYDTNSIVHILACTPGGLKVISKAISGTNYPWITHNINITKHGFNIVEAA